MDKNRAATGAPARRARRTGGLILAAATLAAGPAVAAEVNTPIISGIAFRSGATGASQCLAALRGRKLDVNHVFLTHKSFPLLVKNAGALAGAAKAAPLLVASVPLLTADTHAQFAQCAAGAFDGYFRHIGANLQKVGAQGVVARLGWEANSGSHDWGVTNAAQIPNYKSCWRRAATALKAGWPGLLIEWTNAKKGKWPALSLYPGDDLVDLWGVHYYDTGPEKTTQAIWNKYYNATFMGGPWGVNAWLQQAKAHHKKLGMGEWGVWANRANVAPDDPVYMDNMYKFFRSNAADIAYETYLNANAADGGHALCNPDGAPTKFPKAAARYKADWGAAK